MAKERCGSDPGSLPCAAIAKAAATMFLVYKCSLLADNCPTFE